MTLADRRPAARDAGRDASRRRWSRGSNPASTQLTPGADAAQHIGAAPMGHAGRSNCVDAGAPEALASSVVRPVRDSTARSASPTSPNARGDRRDRADPRLHPLGRGARARLGADAGGAYEPGRPVGAPAGRRPRARFPADAARLPRRAAEGRPRRGGDQMARGPWRRASSSSAQPSNARGRSRTRTVRCFRISPDRHAGCWVDNKYRHCERSEAIQNLRESPWIVSLRSQRLLRKANKFHALPTSRRDPHSGARLS